VLNAMIALKTVISEKIRVMVQWASKKGELCINYEHISEGILR